MGRRALACVAMGILVLGACSDDGSRESAGPTEAAPTSASTSDPLEAECDDAAMLAIVDDQLAAARLDTGGEWSPDATSPFDDRTYSQDEFNDQLHFDCSLRALQTTPGGDTRLVLAAWTFPRYGFVVQATDQPSEPHAQLVRFQLLFEEVMGEWIDEQSVWAGATSEGTTVVVGTEDYSVGAVAKAWQADWDPLPPGEITVDAEQDAIAALEATDNRDVAVAEESAIGSGVGTIMFTTPAGQISLAIVGPSGQTDPMQPYLTGPTATREIGGVEVRVTRPGPTDFDVGEVGFVCGSYGWRLMAGFGTAEELVEVGTSLIEHLDC